MNVTANIPQAKFLSMPHKFRAFVAGYGTGKSWVLCMGQCIHSLEHPGVNQGYFAPTYPQIRDIFYPTIDEVAFDFGMNTKVKLADKEVDFYRGKKYYSTTICRSMERPETIIGFKIGNASLDELDTLKLDKAVTTWQKVIARLRWQSENIKNGADIGTTPEGFRLTHQLFVENLVTRPNLKANYGLVQASTYDNEANLPDGYIDSLLEIYPTELIDAYLNGKFRNLKSGTVYNAYNRQKCNSVETIQANEVLHIGMDFNVTHMAARVFVVRQDGWHCVAELNDIYDTPAMVAAINERYNEHKIYVYPDASGGSRKSVDASKTDISVLEQAGYHIRAHAKNPFVKDRIMSVNKQFETGGVKINATACPVTASCLEKQAYDDNGEPDKKSGHDHSNDAIGYPIAYVFPIVKPVVNTTFTFNR